MKTCYPKKGLARICSLFGMTRQAYYQQTWSDMDRNIEQEIVLHLINEIRKKHPRMGGRKLYHLLGPQLVEHSIKMGRDGLFDLMANNGLLVKRRSRKVYTTQSKHWFNKHQNLVHQWVLDGPNKVWVSDITYIKTAGGDLFLSLITDAYSKKILGYKLSKTLKAKHTIDALKMALATLKGPMPELIHHSDRGVQYCCSQYVKLLEDHQIRISMGQNGDPLENAVAERVNGILKEEYLINIKSCSVQQAMEKINQTVVLYNEERPHMSCNMLTPEQAHIGSGILERVWKNYRKYDKPQNLEANGVF